MLAKNILREKVYASHMNLRVLTYLLESVPLLVLKNLFRSNASSTYSPPENFREKAKELTEQLIAEELRLIRRGLYQYPALPQPDAKQHLKNYWVLLQDAYQSVMRSRKNLTKEFDTRYQQELEQLPEYYRRNFHYQTDGYLSPESADLYRHQTEILFRGTLSIMRRILLSPALEALKYQRSSLLKVLDIGCGTGEAIEFLTSNYQNMEIEAIDLSKAYMDKARDSVKNSVPVHFQQMPGEELRFADNSFDIVYSCFVLHEVPQEVRKKILHEAYRVVKPGGTVVFVDSIQLGEQEGFDWALYNFPVEFHEPFYKNYIQKPLRDLHGDLALENLREEVQLLSKSFSYTKPLIEEAK